MTMDNSRFLPNELYEGTNVKKPPVGLRPKWIMQEKRLIEIQEAMRRYIEANMIIPAEWTEEYNELVVEINKRRQK